jgi:hypothetical protein
MQILNYLFQFVLCMSLSIPLAMAENLSIPDKDHRQGMSYKEYSAYRENMRKLMEERRQSPNLSGHPAAQAEKINPKSAYGQGYQSRNSMGDRPERGIDNKPDRPRLERFNRGDMGRR